MTVLDLLAALRGQGFTLTAEGDRIRVTPATRLTPELRDAIRGHRAELVAALGPLAGPADLPAHPAELAATLDMLTGDPAWASRWAARLKTDRPADLDAVRRTVRLMVDLAAARHQAGDIAGFRSWCRFTLDHAAGRHFDEAARRQVTWPSDVEIISAVEAAETFRR